MLTTADKNKIEQFYNAQLHAHGPNVKALNWNDVFTQYTRFKVLSEIGKIDGKSILDYGCGLGDFYKYLSMRFKNFQYTGIDITEEFIKRASASHPDVEFIQGDIGQIAERNFDYIFASGVFSYNVDDAKEKYFDLIQKLFAIAEIGFAFNMLDADFQKTKGVYLSYSKEEVASQVGKLSTNYKIIDGYLPNDFTVFLYK